MFIQPNLDLLILQARITDMIAGITENQFENVFQELQNSITLCISNDDGLISITRTIKNLSILSNPFRRFFVSHSLTKLQLF